MLHLHETCPLCGFPRLEAEETTLYRPTIAPPIYRTCCCGTSRTPLLYRSVTTQDIFKEARRARALALSDS